MGPNQILFSFNDRSFCVSTKQTQFYKTGDIQDNCSQELFRAFLPDVSSYHTCPLLACHKCYTDTLPGWPWWCVGCRNLKERYQSAYTPYVYTKKELTLSCISTMFLIHQTALWIFLLELLVSSLLYWVVGTLMLDQWLLRGSL